MTLSGKVSVIAGTGPGGFLNGYTGDGGPALDAEFSCPTGLAFDRKGNLFVTDHLNNAIRRIDRAGIVTTVAGQGPYVPGPWTPGVGERAGDGGPATLAVFDQPWGIAFDAHGNLLIADREHDAVRMVNTGGHHLDRRPASAHTASPATVALPSRPSSTGCCMRYRRRTAGS